MSKASRQNLLKFLAEQTKPKIPLTHREFAERFVRLPKSGPYRGAAFRCSRQPFSALLFDAFDSGDWDTIIASGPSQSGKTLSAFVIPTLRDVVELRENSLIAVPEADMASDKWDIDFLPTLEASPELAWLIPRKGPGARGGRIKDRVSLENGTEIKIMSRGGQDTAKAGYTAPRLRVTEAAGFSRGTETSQETDPLGQLRARMRAFKRGDPRRSLIVEGTLTTETELPWRARGEDDDEAIISTRSRILAPCPHCDAWILPERKQLVGWQNAGSEDEAANKATWLCPECTNAINDDQRRASLSDCRLVHWGQTVGVDGEVLGETPPTSTLWFHWQAWHNCLLDAADQAIEEWKLAQLEDGTVEAENKEKENCQFVFSVPYVSKLTDNEPINPQRIRKRRDKLPRGVIHPDTLHVTIGVDWGKWTAWWLAIAWRENGLLHVPNYGAFDVCRNPADEVSTRLLESLLQFNDEVVREGFIVDGMGETLLPSIVLADIGWMPDEIAAGIRATGSKFKGPWLGARGRGKSTANGGYNHPPKVSLQRPRIGAQWYAEWDAKRSRQIAAVTFNADYWKLFVHDRIRTEVGGKGSLVFYRPESKNEHAKLSNHLASEQLVQEWDEKKGLVDVWKKTGQNHWLDCAAMACVGGDYLGYKLADIKTEDAPEPVEENVWGELLYG